MWREETPEGGNLLASKHHVTSFFKKFPKQIRKRNFKALSQPMGGPNGVRVGNHRKGAGEAKSLLTQLKCVEN